MQRTLCPMVAATGMLLNVSVNVFHSCSVNENEDVVVIIVNNDDDDFVVCLMLMMMTMMILLL